MSNAAPDSALAIAADVASQRRSATDVCREFLARIEKSDPHLHAFIQITRDHALARAAAIDQDIAAGRPVGPLAGVPIALKDNICTTFSRTTCASKILANYVSPFDATVVTRIEAAGGIIIGKTNLDEFAMGSSTENSAFFTTRNPWDTTRVPGGSSGGSTVAVATRMAALALGSDTGGSIRQPASLTGVVGLKPTYGRVSRYGLVAYGSSLDQIGPIANTVSDAALLLTILAAHDPQDSTSSVGPPWPRPSSVGPKNSGPGPINGGAGPLCPAEISSVAAPYATGNPGPLSPTENGGPGPLSPTENGGPGPLCPADNGGPGPLCPAEINDPGPLRPPPHNFLADLADEKIAARINGLRIGLPLEYFGEGLDPRVRAAVESAVAVLEKLGAKPVEISMPHSPYCVAIYYLVATAEASSNLARFDGVHFGHRTATPRDIFDLYSSSRAEGFGPEVKRRIMLGTFALSSGYYDQYYTKSLKARRLVQQDFDRAFEKVDIIACPASPTPAFRIGEKSADPLTMYLADIYTIAANLAGVPAIVLPCGFTTASLGRGEAATGRDEAAPGRDEAAPGRDEAAPGRDEAAPGRDEAAPGRGEAEPDCPQSGTGATASSSGLPGATNRSSASVSPPTTASPLKSPTPGPQPLPPHSLPIGLQLLAPLFAETALLQTARAYERETPWHTHRPPSAAGTT